MAKFDYFPPKSVVRKLSTKKAMCMRCVTQFSLLTEKNDKCIFLALQIIERGVISKSDP